MMCVGMCVYYIAALQPEYHLSIYRVNLNRWVCYVSSAYSWDWILRIGVSCHLVTAVGTPVQFSDFTCHVVAVCGTPALECDIFRARTDIDDNMCVCVCVRVCVCVCVTSRRGKSLTIDHQAWSIINFHYQRSRNIKRKCPTFCWSNASVLPRKPTNGSPVAFHVTSSSPHPARLADPLQESHRGLWSVRERRVCTRHDDLIC